MSLRIPILVYHSVSAAPRAWIAPFAVTPEVFASHLDAITAAGATAITVSELVDELRNGAGRLPERPVLLTFDDGFADFRSVARPLLSSHGFSATLYVVTAYADTATGPGGERMLDWSELAELEAAGVELGAHTHTHPQLDVVNQGVARYEILHSKALLEERLATRIRSFAYPHGYSSAGVRRLVHSAGFDSACAVGNAFSHPRDDRYRLARIMVRSRTGAGEVSAWMAGAHAPLAPRRERISTRAWRGYRRAAVRAGIRGEREP